MRSILGAMIMNRSFCKSLVIAFVVMSPVVSLLAVRSAASWRPQKVLSLPYKGDIIMSPDERLIAIASPDEQGLVSVRSLPSGQEVMRRTLHRHISSLAFSPDGRRLAIGWSKSTRRKLATDTKRIGISLWNIKGQYRDFEMVKGDWVYDEPTQLRFSPDGITLWMASTDNLRSWSIGSGKLKWQWHNLEGRDSSLPFHSALSTDCRLNFRSDSDGYAVWDTGTKKRLLRAKLPFLQDANLHFSSDASVATYYADTPKGILNPVVDTRTGRVLWQSKGEPELTFIGDKAVRHKANTFEVCDARNGKLLYTLSAYPNTVPLSSASRRWLYTVKDKKELFRQRLH
jgi:WD40 repeat protein